MIVRVVSNVFSHSLPPDTFQFLFLHAVEQRLHSRVIRRIRLDEVDQVELVLSEPPRIIDLEEIPLSEVLSVVVRLHYQVVLLPFHLDCPPQVPRFEAGLELEGVVCLLVDGVERLKAIKVTVGQGFAFLGLG